MGEFTNKYRRTINPKNDTEGGMNRAERATTLSWEAKQRNARTERVAVIDRNGKMVGENLGGKSKSNWNRAEVVDAHRMMKYMAKKYGWIYTRRKNGK